VRPRSWLGVIVLAIVVVAGLLLLVWLLRGPQAEPTPTPRPSAPPTEPHSPTPSPLPVPSPTPGPYLYVVQEGDTLFSIAAAYGVSLDELIAANSVSDPNLIRPGDALVIPGRTAPVAPEQPGAVEVPLPTTPPRTPVPTPTSVGPPVVQIASALGAGILEWERVGIRNLGGQVVMEGWTLSDADGNEFAFPRLVLFPGGEVVVYSGSGQNSPTQLYWGRSEPAWNSGELVVLKDHAGQTVDTYIVP
jgi:LysM repeat protein